MAKNVRMPVNLRRNAHEAAVCEQMRREMAKVKHTPDPGSAKSVPVHGGKDKKPD